MKIWIDAQLSPAIARWINADFDVEGGCRARLEFARRGGRGNFFSQQKKKTPL
jgi:hypothetical protein